MLIEISLSQQIKNVVVNKQNEKDTENIFIRTDDK